MSTTKRAAMSVDIFNTTVTVTFANGQDLAVDVSTLTPEIQQQAMLHGIKQKLVDAGALSRNTETDKPASVEDKYKSVEEVHGRLLAGVWHKERTKKADETVASKDLLARALMQMTGKDRAYVDDYLSAKTKEQRAALKKNPRVVSIVAELSAATVSNGINTDELLGELIGELEQEEPVMEIVAENPRLVAAPGVSLDKPKRSRKPAPVAA